MLASLKHMAAIDREALALPDLLMLYGNIQREFQGHGVSRTAGSIEGGIGERLTLKSRHLDRLSSGDAAKNSGRFLAQLATRD